MKPRILLAVQANRENYIGAVTACGGNAHAEYCPAVSTDYDGLILCGGADLDPVYYGEPINGSVDIDPQRDRAELALAEAYLAAGKPVFGICRGLQLLNVVLGGSLHQHIPTADLHVAHGGSDPIHEVTAQPGSLFAQLYGERFVVNSSHHQAIAVPGSGVQVVLTHDGVAEGFVHESLPVLGVQWHPERMCFANRRDDTVDGAVLFHHFLNLCR